MFTLTDFLRFLSAQPDDGQAHDWLDAYVRSSCDGSPSNVCIHRKEIAVTFKCAFTYRHQMDKGLARLIANCPRSATIEQIQRAGSW